MPAVQTNYPDVMPVAIPGALGTMVDGNIISRTVETANVPFGRAVKQGTADNGCALFGSGDTVVLGVSVVDRSAEGFNATTETITRGTFGVGESARILPVGSGRDVWLICASGCSAGDGVFVRPSNGDFQDSNVNSAVQIAGARWDTSATAGQLALARLA